MDFEDCYGQIYDFKNLYTSYKLAARCKRSKRDVIDFEYNLASNLWKLHYELKDGRYRLSGYYHFKIYDPKERDIQALYFKDRVMQHSLCDNVLRPYFENRLIYDCAACRQGKGTRFAVDRMTEFMRRFYGGHGTSGYILKCDIRKYFDNIDHDILKDRLKRFPDDRVRKLLYDIIDSFNANTGKGLPLGNQSSQWFALYYLDPLDRRIKEKWRIKYYTRYMDDLILIHEDKGYLKQVLEDIREYAADILKLEFNDKTQLFPISEGADYVGWHFYLTDTGKVVRLLRTSNKRRFKRRLKGFKKKYNRYEMTLDEIKRSLSSYNGHLKQGHTYRLRKNIYSKFVLTHAKKDDE
ncbi:MAG: reverse transcriptase [Lachnospiraceae bacterium]|nr:reverse transcriptase [Lachnospiraceae bacterium]